MLLDQARIRAVVVGRDYTYGAQRAGTVSSLTEAAMSRGAVVAVVEPVTVNGVVASSSRIREYILEGRVGAARALLGRPFDLDGVVVKGDGRGRSIGFPTANVDSHGELLPASGVYAVRVRTGDRWHGGAANIGTKPTFGGSAVTVEVHLLDWSGDLYGQEVRVEFLERLRAERRFASVSELTAQIRRDVEEARVVLARTSAVP
jgi:riboflavin kinase/FMN adenylyltransferase